MKAHIIYSSYLSRDGKHMTIGGIQTYITELSKVLYELGYSVNIYQQSDFPFRVELDKCRTVIGCRTVLGWKNRLKKRAFKPIKNILFDKCLSFFEHKNDILIFGCESLLTNTRGIPAIAIQHGISWDKPDEKIRNKYVYFYYYLLKSYRAWNIICRNNKANTLVCVDYNFVNWYRALVAYPKINLKVIPNFSMTSVNFEKSFKESDVINIVFARRFFKYRGTRIFLDAIIKILNEYNNIHITIAGEGPDESILKHTLGNDNRVSFTNYRSEFSLEFHKDKHIAVIPTTGSEGTSLSLLEAMASKCAVICTNVGGMTNIVIDGFNGLMIHPDSEELYNAIKKLINDRDMCTYISNNAYTTVVGSFSREKWRNRWKEFIMRFKSHN